MSARRARVSSLLATALALLALPSVGCSCGADTIAELREATGPVERDDAPEGETWHATAVGDGYGWDEAVRTGADGTAAVVVGGTSGIRLRPNTVVRFRREPEQRTGIELESGEAELESEGQLSLVTQAGEVRLERGSRVRLQFGHVQHIEVIAGRVVLEDGRVAEAGRSIEVEVGSIEIEAPLPLVTPAAWQDDAGAPEVVAEAVEESDAGVPADETDARETLLPSPARAHVSIPAGESATVHDASAPTAVRFELPAACTGASYVSLSSGARGGVRFAGTGAILALVQPGRFRYAIHCGSGQAPGGTITVRRDDGSLRLESVAPRNVVDADGRTYDVLYQNALPVVTFRWAQAGAGPYQVILQSGGRSRTIASNEARYVFDSGAVRDGEHVLTFVAGTRRSSPTRLRVRFDNAAPTAHIREPRGSVARGTVHVAGQAIEGARVSVTGTALELDRDNRFEGDAAAPADLDALSIRFAHPRSGVHYYLRRLQ